MPDQFGEPECSAVAQSMLQRYVLITKDWDSEKNTEWICRLFTSAKLILTATLQVNAMLYAEDRNLRVVVPYLRYYSVLSLARAVCYSLPEVSWQGGEAIRISHKAAIAAAIAHLKRFRADVGIALEQEIRQLKADRELLSYRAPSSADEQIGDKNRFLGLCRLLAEAAQFDSELFESSLDKHAPDVYFELDAEVMGRVSNVELDGHVFSDSEDAIRIDYLSRRYQRPANILHMMTEGHTESYFGWWCADEPKEGDFDPDEMTGVIFDVP